MGGFSIFFRESSHGISRRGAHRSAEKAFGDAWHSGATGTPGNFRDEVVARIIDCRPVGGILDRHSVHCEVARFGPLIMASSRHESLGRTIVCFPGLFLCISTQFLYNLAPFVIL